MRREKNRTEENKNLYNYVHEFFEKRRENYEI